MGWVLIIYLSGLYSLVDSEVFKALSIERASELDVDEGRGRASIFEDETIGEGHG